MKNRSMVIAALSDAVDKVSWSKDPKAFKVVYLVGDAPPHEDYADAPKLAAVMEKAVRRGLIVNAAPCGSDASMMAAFERVARSGEGRLLPVPQDGGMVAVATPFDAPLAELAGKLEDTGLAYGSGRARRGGRGEPSRAQGHLRKRSSRIRSKDSPRARGRSGSTRSWPNAA